MGGVLAFSVAAFAGGLAGASFLPVDSSAASCSASVVMSVPLYLATWQTFAAVFAVSEQSAESVVEGVAELCFVLVVVELSVSCFVTFVRAVKHSLSCCSVSVT